MLGTIAIVLFIVLDMALVIGALLWLNERRSEDDRTDVRYRSRTYRRYWD